MLIEIHPNSGVFTSVRLWLPWPSQRLASRLVAQPGHGNSSAVHSSEVEGGGCFFRFFACGPRCTAFRLVVSRSGKKKSHWAKWNSYITDSLENSFKKENWFYLGVGFPSGVLVGLHTGQQEYHLNQRRTGLGRAVAIPQITRQAALFPLSWSNLAIRIKS